MYGKSISELPDGFESHHQCPEIMSHLNIPTSFKPGAVGTKPVGVRWHTGPLCLERYIGDDEPRLGTGPTRIVLWYRLMRTDRPKGWHQWARRGLLEGFAELKPGLNYDAEWSQSSRRYRNRWRQRVGVTHELVSPSMDEFETAYRAGTVFKRFGASSIIAIRRKWETDPRNISLRAVRDLNSGLLVAGMGTIDASGRGISFYECGFVVPGADSSFMTALMDDWFNRSHARGLRFLHFGVFWAPGSPSAWKGFSKFKAKFCPSYLRLQPVLFKFVRASL